MIPIEPTDRFDAIAEKIIGDNVRDKECGYHTSPSQLRHHIARALEAAVAEEREATRPTLQQCLHLVNHELEFRPNEAREGGLRLKKEIEDLLARGKPA